MCRGNRGYLFYGVIVRVLDGAKNGNLELGMVNEKGERNGRMVRKFEAGLARLELRLL